MSSFHYAFDDKFELMVFLYAEPALRIQRVQERAVERFGERVLAGGDLYENHLRFLDDNRRYETNGSPNLNEQREWLNNMSCMKIELDGKDNLESNCNTVVEKWKQLI
jgi:chromosome condensin MukBEF MukE localization factor